MWFWTLLSNLLSFVLIYFMVLTNTDTKAFYLKTSYQELVDGYIESGRELKDFCQPFLS